MQTCLVVLTEVDPILDTVLFRRFNIRRQMLSKSFLTVFVATFEQCRLLLLIRAHELTAWTTVAVGLLELLGSNNYWSLCLSQTDVAVNNLRLFRNDDFEAHLVQQPDFFVAKNGIRVRYARSKQVSLFVNEVVKRQISESITFIRVLVHVNRVIAIRWLHTITVIEWVHFRTAPHIGSSDHNLENEVSCEQVDGHFVILVNN